MSSSSSKKKQSSVSVLDKYSLMGLITTDGDGEVFRAVEKKTGQAVAVKKYCDEREVKEIAYLTKLNCPFVLPVLDVGHDCPGSVAVFRFYPHTLRNLISEDEEHSRLTPAVVRRFLHQLLTAASHCHKLSVIHRSLMPENILIDDELNLKVRNFGFARDLWSLAPAEGYTPPHMALLPYRAPELLLGELNYGAAVDIWAIGVIFAEMVNRITIFAVSAADFIECEDDLTKFEELQRQTIFRVLGTPTEETWPKVTMLPKWSNQIQSNPPQQLAGLMNITLGAEGVDLLSELLVLDPAKRITAEAALQHSYFNP